MELCQLDYGWFDWAHNVRGVRARAKVRTIESERVTTRNIVTAATYAQKGNGVLVQIINKEIIMHPMNWIIIFLMLVIAAIAGHQLLSLAQLEPAVSNN